MILYILDTKGRTWCASASHTRAIKEEAKSKGRIWRKKLTPTRHPECLCQSQFELAGNPISGTNSSTSRTVNLGLIATFDACHGWRKATRWLWLIVRVLLATHVSLRCNKGVNSSESRRHGQCQAAARILFELTGHTEARFLPKQDSLFMSRSKVLYDMGSRVH